MTIEEQKRQVNTWLFEDPFGFNLEEGVELKRVLARALIGNEKSGCLYLVNGMLSGRSTLWTAIRESFSEYHKSFSPQELRPLQGQMECRLWFLTRLRKNTRLAMGMYTPSVIDGNVVLQLTGNAPPTVRKDTDIKRVNVPTLLVQTDNFPDITPDVGDRVRVFQTTIEFHQTPTEAHHRKQNIAVSDSTSKKWFRLAFARLLEETYHTERPPRIRHL